jgi:hypothetical protein
MAFEVVLGMVVWSMLMGMRLTLFGLARPGALFRQVVPVTLHVIFGAHENLLWYLRNCEKAECRDARSRLRELFSKACAI